MARIYRWCIGLAKISRVKYFTEEKKKLISQENLELYKKYLKSSILKNRDVASTTYKVYENNMTQFMVYLAEFHDNMSLYSAEMVEFGVDVMEGFMSFCQEVLQNNKKAVNNKIAAVSSFYNWSLKRKLISVHPFDKKLDRIKGANEEKIINSYFLSDEEIETVRNGLLDEKKFDIQDRLLWELMLSSGNRVGAISKLKLSVLDLDNSLFNDIREKRGYKVEVVFSEEARELLIQWMDIRKDLDELKVDSPFITRYSGEYREMSYGTIQERVRKIGTILGLDDFHAHCIRKTTLNQIYEQTGDMTLAAEIANHKSIETTKQSYIKPKSKAEVMAKIQQIRNKNRKVSNGKDEQ